MLSRTIASFALGLLLALPSLSAHAADEQVLNGFAFWRGSGQVVQSGEHNATFAGALAGEFYVESDQGPVHAGHVQCPGIFKVDLESGKQTGSGSCAFTAEDGAMAYGEWDCQGVLLLGCKGTFTLTGGAGRLEGVTGESKLMFRADFHQLVQTPGQITEDNSYGIAVWRDLRVSRPVAEGN